MVQLKGAVYVECLRKATAKSLTRPVRRPRKALRPSWYQLSWRPAGSGPGRAEQSRAGPAAARQDHGRHYHNERHRLIRRHRARLQSVRFGPGLSPASAAWRRLAAADDVPLPSPPPGPRWAPSLLRYSARPRTHRGGRCRKVQPATAGSKNSSMQTGRSNIIIKATLEFQNIAVSCGFYENQNSFSFKGTIKHILYSLPLAGAGPRGSAPKTPRVGPSGLLLVVFEISITVRDIYNLIIFSSSRVKILWVHLALRWGCVSSCPF